jgi:membrane protein implicated in regulation of membrane protease activity
MPSVWVPLIWLVVAAMLLTLELAQPSFDGLMFAAIAALVVSAVTAIGPLPVVAQLSAFLIITVAGTWWLMRWSAHRNPDPASQRQRQDLAEVISSFPDGGEGRVRWRGQSWAATSLELERPLTQGTRVLVVGRDGTHLQVMATEPFNQSKED